MPLTLQLYGSEPDNEGHLIIDRNNIIFVYKAVSTEPDHIQSVLNKKTRLQEAVDANHAYDQYLLSDDETFMDTIGDPRHDALEHSSLYDKQSFHYHLVFRKDVELKHLELVFENLSLDNIEDLISKECRQEILTIAAEYFHDLAHSPFAQSIETEYRIMKTDEMKKAIDEISNHERKIATSTVNLLMQKFGFMAKKNLEQFEPKLLELDDQNESVETQQISDESASKEETSTELTTEMLESTNLSNENLITQASSNQLRRSSSPVLFSNQNPTSNIGNSEKETANASSTPDARRSYPSFS